MNIKALRKEIDKIDRQIVKLLNKRADISFKIMLEKQKQGLQVIESVEDAEDRIERVYSTIKKHSKGPLQETQLKRIFLEIMCSTPERVGVNSP